jgi:hypothetical protein
MGFLDFLSGPRVYVSPPDLPGGGGGTGSPTDPFHSVADAISKVNGGGIVYLHRGNYIENVHLNRVSGRFWRKIRVRPFGDGEVFIDSMLPAFLTPGAGGQWDAIPLTQGVAGEYVWSSRFEAPGGPQTGRAQLGAFLDMPAHTRLVTYGEVADLRADNQGWPMDPKEGNQVWRESEGVFWPEDRANHVTHRPCVYMGPGIWFDEDVRACGPGDVGGRRLHIRLAPTSNGVPDWPDYAGESDPNKLRLAISLENTHAVFLKNSNHVQFENLTLRFGNPDTVRLNNCSDITFDHVRIRSGSRAIRLVVDNDRPNDRVRRIQVAHCEIDGGIPTWFFRSDRKDTYIIGPAGAGPATASEVRVNRLGASTSGVQISGTKGCSDVTVHHCEIFNAHDSYVFGVRMRFHHNWLRNLNDDGIALAIDAETEKAEIFCNVMTKCLTAFSFANKPVGIVYIYGNLIDIREPTLGRRPSGDTTPDSLRQGHFFKDGLNEGPIELFHNTCLVLDPGAKGEEYGDLNRAGFGYYRTIGQSKERRSFNNIMVAVFSPQAGPLPIAFLPPKDCGRTDGNTYFRIPAHESDNFIVRRWSGIPGEPTEHGPYLDLPEYRKHYWPNGVDGYEEFGTRRNPDFRSLDIVTGFPRGTDDFRLRGTSVAKGSAVTMPQDLEDKYRAAIGAEPKDPGCYPLTGERLRVGVDGRKVYPPSRPVLETHDADARPQQRGER